MSNCYIFIFFLEFAVSEPPATAVAAVPAPAAYLRHLFYHFFILQIIK